MSVCVLVLRSIHQWIDSLCQRQIFRHGLRLKLLPRKNLIVFYLVNQCDTDFGASDSHLHVNFSAKIILHYILFTLHLAANVERAPISNVKLCLFLYSILSFLTCRPFLYFRAWCFMLTVIMRLCSFCNRCTILTNFVRATYVATVSVFMRLQSSAQVFLIGIFIYLKTGIFQWYKVNLLLQHFFTTIFFPCHNLNLNILLNAYYLQKFYLTTAVKLCGN